MMKLKSRKGQEYECVRNDVKVIGFPTGGIALHQIHSGAAGVLEGGKEAQEKGEARLDFSHGRLMACFCFIYQVFYAIISCSTLIFTS